MFKKTNVKVQMCLKPVFIGNVEIGVRRTLDKFLLKYYREFNGVVISYSNVRVSDKNSKLVSDLPSFHFNMSVDFVLFSPTINSEINGTVINVGYDNIGILVMGLFNASIPITNIRKDFERGKSKNRWIDKTNPLSVIERGNIIRFTVKNIKPAKGIISIIGSLEDPKTGPIIEDNKPLTDDTILGNDINVFKENIDDKKNSRIVFDDEEENEEEEDNDDDVDVDNGNDVDVDKSDSEEENDVINYKGGQDNSDDETNLSFSESDEDDIINNDFMKAMEEEQKEQDKLEENLIQEIKREKVFESDDDDDSDDESDEDDIDYYKDSVKKENKIEEKKVEHPVIKLKKSRKRKRVSDANENIKPPKKRRKKKK
eukprot:TRINITY_DN2239_c1_g1_i1.p1 TRINITY_DN2239_c1_g1~~TRINITY_DN2239_c1_g1_i1.p1  ORF type:complete len:371 (+),score=136.47 TRINITY_DN2239_c1_g1_i1:65-1177(+)